MTEINTELMLKVADELQGTAEQLEHALGNHGVDIDDVPIEMLQRLDDEVMVCECCGWWCETSDLDDEQICSSCQD